MNQKANRNSGTIAVGIHVRIHIPTCSGMMSHFALRHADRRARVIRIPRQLTGVRAFGQADTSALGVKESKAPNRRNRGLDSVWQRPQQLASFKKCLKPETFFLSWSGSGCCQDSETWPACRRLPNRRVHVTRITPEIEFTTWPALRGPGPPVNSACQKRQKRLKPGISASMRHAALLRHGFTSVCIIARTIKHDFRGYAVTRLSKFS